MTLRLRVLDTLTKRDPLTDWPFQPSGAADVMGAAVDCVVTRVGRLTVRMMAAVTADRRIRVSPMSETWLQTHAVEHAKHVDEA